MDGRLFSKHARRGVVRETDLVKVNFRLTVREYLEIRRLVEKGEYSSLSELVRHAIERLLDEYSAH